MDSDSDSGRDIASRQSSVVPPGSEEKLRVLKLLPSRLRMGCRVQNTAVFFISTFGCALRRNHHRRKTKLSSRLAVTAPPPLHQVLPREDPGRR